MDLSPNGSLWAIWSTSFAVWLMIFMYAFWQFSRAARNKDQIIYVWLGFLVTWIGLVVFSLIVRRFM